MQRLLCSTPRLHVSCLAPPEKLLPWKHRPTVHNNGGRVRGRSDERNGTEQVRWRAESMIDSSDVGTVGSDTCAAPGWGYSTWTRHDNLLATKYNNNIYDYYNTKDKGYGAVIVAEPLRAIIQPNEPKIWSEPDGRRPSGAVLYIRQMNPLTHDMKTFVTYATLTQ